MTRLNGINGMDERTRERLIDAGVRTPRQLLEIGATPGGRLRLVDMTRADEMAILDWIHQADLMRVPGVGPRIANLLCRVEVTTVPKLAYRSAEALHQLLQRSSLSLRESSSLPTLRELRLMIAAAKSMPKFVRH